LGHGAWTWGMDMGHGVLRLKTWAWGMGYGVLRLG